MSLPRFNAIGRYALVLLAMACPVLAAAQTTVTTSGNANLNAINSGDVTLNGSINNPTVNGGQQNSFNLVAQGASINYDPQSQLTGAAVANGNGSVTVDVNGGHWSATNSGTITVNGEVGGIQQPSLNGNVAISAIGLQSGVSIRTTPGGN